MKEQFSSAEELMEHLKKQIIRFPEEEDIIDVAQGEYRSSNNSQIDLSKFFVERESNNILWTVSADRPITSHRKITGKFIVFGKKAVRKLLRWYVSKTFELQTSFNGTVTRSFNELSNVLIQVTAKLEENEAALKEQRQYTEMLELKLNAKEEIVKEQLTRLRVEGESLNERIQELGTKEENLIERLQEIDHQEEILNERLTSFISKEEVNVLADKMKMATDLNAQNSEKFVTQLYEQMDSKIGMLDEKFKAETNFMQYRIRQIKKNAADNNQQFSKIAITKENIRSNEQEADSNSFDYLHFENKFRGSLDEIKNRQKVYLPYFANKQNILDIGCGRGEFVELLIDNNISVKGIDLNQEMVEFCQDRGLPVEYDDAINYLNTVENNDLGGIFLGQVIEHMTFEQIIQLVELAFSKLKPGSHLIMETPNPLSLAIFYRTFYVDPTHVKPVHPLTIQYLVESVGFSKTELIYSSRIEPNWWLPQLQASDNAINNVDEFNQGINRINDLLYGNLDYAIIAKK